MKRPPPGRIVPRARPRECFIQQCGFGYELEEIFAPPLSFLRFALATKEPGAQSAMVSLVVCHHMRFNDTNTRLLGCCVVEPNEAALPDCAAEEFFHRFTPSRCGATTKIVLPMVWALERATSAIASMWIVAIKLPTSEDMCG